MKRFMLFVFLCVSISSAQDLESRLTKKAVDFTAQTPQPLAQREDVASVHVLAAEGADAIIYERNNLYTWKLLREYYYDYDSDTTGPARGIYLDYNPNTNLARSFPAVFSLWHSKPQTSLTNYRDTFIAASKSVAGSSYLEVSNKPDTLYQNIPGWDYSYQYRSGSSTLFIKSHILYFNGAAFNIFLITYKTDYDDFISRLWYALVFADVDFNTGTAVAERENFENLRSFFLLQNYPNPFNAATVIPYKIVRRALVSLDVFNLNGQLVERIFQKMHDPGEFRVQWDGQYPSGIYFYKISDGVQTNSKQMLLVK